MLTVTAGLLIGRRARQVYRQGNAVDWAEYCDLQDDWASYSAKLILGTIALMALLQLLSPHPDLGAMACLAGLYIVLGVPIVLVATQIAKGVIFPDCRQKDR